MNRTQYAALQDMATLPQTLSIGTVGTNERTLAFGYTCARQTWHAYVLDGEMHVAIYDFNGTLVWHIHGTELPVKDLRPDKRVYPERTEFAFAALMKVAEAPLSLLNFADGDPEKEFVEQQYYGRVFDIEGNEVALLNGALA